jgi:aminopeptidase N
LNFTDIKDSQKYPVIIFKFTFLCSTLDGEEYIVDLYKPTVPMSSYMNAFCVHNYIPVRRADTINGRLLRFWTRPEWQSRAQYIANITNSMLTTFDQTYGTKYPFNKLGKSANNTKSFIQNPIGNC